MKTRNLIKIYIIRVWSCAVMFGTLLQIAGCKKLVEIDPPINSIVGPEIYKSNSTANAAIIGIYTDMSNYNIFAGLSSMQVATGLSGDELMTVSPPQNIFSLLYVNGLTNNGDQLFWTPLYRYVFYANAAIEGLSQSEGLTFPVKQQLMGEAKFLRAFYYFQLLNLYGDVPLLLTTDPTITGIAPRINKDQISQQIIKDLQEAKETLNINYVSGDALSSSNIRVRPNKAVATALLAKVYLYAEQWAHAESEANALIEDSKFRLESLEAAFLMGSREAIWQLQPVNIDRNSPDAEAFVLSVSPENLNGGPSESRPVHLSKSLFNSFEANDQRRKIWIDSVEVAGVVYPYAYKYKAFLPGPRTEYTVVFRLGEQYLIRAEARAHLQKISGTESALSDLNAIRDRAGLGALDIADPQLLLKEISKERQRELFTEGSNRWFDLKRTGEIDQVMIKLNKGSGWAPYKALYPIPVQDIAKNPALRGKQSPGYPEQ